VSAPQPIGPSSERPSAGSACARSERGRDMGGTYRAMLGAACAPITSR
jgi:hypothetical protein